jgi:hypothetical protein
MTGENRFTEPPGQILAQNERDEVPGPQRYCVQTAVKNNSNPYTTTSSLYSQFRELERLITVGETWNALRKKSERARPSATEEQITPRD